MSKKNKTKAVQVPEEKAIALMPEKERWLLDAMKEKLDSRLPISFKGGMPEALKDKSEALSFAALMEACNTSDVNGALQTVNNAAAGQYWEDADTSLSVALSQIAELEPQTLLEAMIISQMVAVNTSIGKLMGRAMFKDQTFAGKEVNINLATKLQRTFLQQIEALQKLRGKGQQTVRVEHVTVNAGGQAIVGNVEHKSGGRGQR